MAEKIRLVRNDTAPQIRLTITDQESGSVVDLSNGSVKLHFRRVGATAVLFTKDLFVNPDTANTGVAVVVWEPGDLDVEAGDYEGEIEVIRSNGMRETIYDLLKFKVREEFA